MLLSFSESKMSVFSFEYLNLMQEKPFVGVIKYKEVHVFLMIEIYQSNNWLVILSL